MAPVQEEAPPTLDTARVTQIVAFLGDQRRTQSNMKFQLSNGDAEQLRLLASALPALLEASRERDALKKSLVPRIYPFPCGLCPAQIESEADLDWHGLGNCVEVCDTCGGSGSSDKVVREGGWRALAVRAARELGETNGKLRDAEHDLSKAEAAVARLTTEKAALEAEREKFRDWFQNAEQARVVAEANAERFATENRELTAQLNEPIRGVWVCSTCGFTHQRILLNPDTGASGPAPLIEAENCPNDGTPMRSQTLRERAKELMDEVLFTKKRCFEMDDELRASRKGREQAIQDIEALPSMRLVNMDNREVIARDEVRRILRGDE